MAADTGHCAVIELLASLGAEIAATNENDLVLDPFNGSGTTGVACVTNNRNYVGIELEKSYIELTKKRINEIENDLF